MKNPKSIALILAAIIGLGAFTGEIQAQGIKFFGQDNSSTNVQAAFPSMKQNVYAIDSLADKMAFRYGWEFKRNKDCSGCQALYTQMKRHAELTNTLIKAYKGDNANSFRRAARDVSNSIETLERLKTNITVSSSISTMIDQSAPFAAFVARNADTFQPMAAVAKQDGKST